MRLQTEQMSLGIIGPEQGFSREPLAGDLVAHLVILMGPHIVADRGGQRIECQHLQPFRPLAVSCAGIQQFVGVHLLHHGAKFRTLDGTAAGQALIAGKQAHRRTVIFIQNSTQHFRFVGIGIAQQLMTHSFRLQHHRQIDNMGLKCPLVKRPLPAVCQFFVIFSLFLQNPRQIRQPCFRILFIGKVNGDKTLKPPGFPPTKQADLTGA